MVQEDSSTYRVWGVPEAEGESLLLECGKITNLLPGLILSDPLFQCTAVVVVVWIEGLVDPTGSTIIDLSVIGTL